jgi:hypothetical protein
MLEKDLEDVLCKYPELIEQGLSFLGRQVSLSGKFADILLKDRFGKKLIIELKKGVIKREHIAQLLDYEGYFLSPDEPDVRVMLIGNRVPPNLRKSLDHHGFEWREISVPIIINTLEDKKDNDLLIKFKEAENEVKKPTETGINLEVPRLIKHKSNHIVRRSTSERTGLPRYDQAVNFEELKEMINIRCVSVPSCYMDKLLLENSNKTISQILEEQWRPFSEPIGDHHFLNISNVRKHIKYREARGWKIDYSGNQTDPVVRLVGFNK